jgi:peptidoglycan/LPS O-acetylase OafA/YrhL
MAQIGTATVGPASAKPGRVDALDGLRFLAAFFIVVYHYGNSAPVRLDTLSPFFARGWVATDFFLILSGFVLGRAYGGSLDAGRIGGVSFFVRRLQRIWPAHLIVLAGFVVLLVVTTAVGIAPLHPDHFRLVDLAEEAALVQAWGLSNHLGWNAPSWSLSALAVCYAFFPFVWRLSRSISGKAAALMCAFDVLALAALGSRMVLHEAAYDLSVQYALVRAIPLFLCGLFMARAAAGMNLSRRDALCLTGGSLLALGMLQCSPRGDLVDLATVTAIGLGVLGVNAITGFRSKLAARGGALSFSLFITHSLSAAVWFGLTRAVATRLELPTAGQWLLWACAFPFALGVAWVFDKVVDAPLQKLFKAVRTRPVVAVAPSGETVH